MFRQPYMCMSQHFPLPMFDTYFVFSLFMRYSPGSEAIGVLTSSMGGVACLRFGGSMLVPLEGAAVRVACALWGGHAGAATECRCRVSLQAAA